MPPVGVPKVKLPLLLPQVALVGVTTIFVGPGVIVNVAETVNVQPKLFVNVITGVPAPKPVTVCPEIEPRLLAKLEIVCAQQDVLFIIIIPLLFPQVGFVNDNVAEGFGLITTAIVPVDTHPSVLVPETLYVPVAGVAVETAEPVVVVKPEPDHVYVDAPLAIKLSVPPKQNGAFEATESVEAGGAVTVTVFVIEVPQTVFVMVTE